MAPNITAGISRVEFYKFLVPYGFAKQNLKEMAFRPFKINLNWNFVIERKTSIRCLQNGHGIW